MILKLKSIVIIYITMASKTLWHTIQIKVPAEMIELTKTGKVSVKKTLTKTLNISKSQKKPAIKLKNWYNKYS